MATIEGTNAPDASSTLTELEDTGLVEDSVSSSLSYCALYISFPFFSSVTHSYCTLLVLLQRVTYSLSTTCAALNYTAHSSSETQT